MSENEAIADEILEDDGAIVGDIDPVTLAMFEESGVGPFADKDDDADIEDESGEEPEAEDATEEVTADEPEYAFELEDGTKVTLEEAKQGYLRQSDYTKKTQATAEERRAIEQNQALLDYISNNPDIQGVILDNMRGVKKQTQATPEQVIQVPENYKGDPFVEGIVSVVGELKKEITDLKGTTTSIAQERTQQAQQSEFQTKLEARFQDSYDKLKGQVETPPTTQEFSDRITAYFDENGINKQAAAQMIANGHDPRYLTSIVEQIFKADIQKVKQTEVKAVEKQRKKRTAKGTALRVAGKSGKAPARPLPKKSDGTIDQEELGRWIIEPKLADRV